MQAFAILIDGKPYTRARSSRPRLYSRESDAKIVVTSMVNSALQNAENEFRYNYLKERGIERGAYGTDQWRSYWEEYSKTKELFESLKKEKEQEIREHYEIVQV